MAKAIETLSIKLDFKDTGTQQILDKIKSSFKGLGQVVTGNTKPAIQKLRNEINTFASQGNRSISTIDAQVTALRALRREADFNSKEFKELTADITKYERQLSKVQGSRSSGGARKATQIAGAVVSGGIFGGPEGAIGALGGAALGGVEGAFAGAAIGAQLGGIRQALAASADYAASIQKLRIALRGVAGSQEEYTSALSSAASVTRSLNVPQEAAIRGVTRLTAAVKGAGGPISDAEKTFENVTAAIKATGGSSEDVQGAITAMVQVFSKGKVSAEELSGQLGERLPGAVTKFAEANDMTLPELQKNLKAGTVGLNELMRFIEALGEEYSGTALKIADSNAEAGARLTVAFDQMKASIGEALLDTGAEFQNTFTKFIEDITPSMVKAAKIIANALSGLAENLTPILAGLGTFVGILTAGGIVFAVKSLATALGLFGAAAASSATGVAALTASMLANPLFLGAAAVGGIVAGIVAVTRALNRQKRELQEIASLKKGETYANLSNERRQEQISSVSALKASAVKELRDREASGLDYGVNLTKMNALRKKIAGYDKQLERLTTPVKKKEKEEAFDYGDPSVDGGGGAKAIVSDRQVDLAQRLAQAEGTVGQRVQATLKYMLARQKVLDRNLDSNKEQVALAEVLKRFRAEIFRIDEQELAQAEREAQELARKNDLIQQARVLAGEITQEEYEQAKTLTQMKTLLADQPELYEKIKSKLEEAATPLGKFKAGLKTVFEEAMNVNEALANAGVQAVQKFGDAFADFVATGKASFKELTVSILQDLSRIFARAALFQALSFIPGVGNFLGLGAANGAVISSSAKNGIVPFAKGGIVDKPTLFKYASGGTGRFGLMGEAGPEAIMPLRRGANGKLGVEATAGVGNIIVNVDASDSAAQGDGRQAQQLGKAIGAAVQAELIKQKRPGGLLS